MDNRAEVRDFLTTRRARVTPETVGLILRTEAGRDPRNKELHDLISELSHHDHQSEPGDDMTDPAFDQIFPLGEPNDAYAQYFAGQSYLAPLTGGSVSVSNVSFEPGCRNNWHIHHGTAGGGDQILLCTAGSGWYQAEGEEPVSLEPGSAIRVPAGTKHWHGAKADSWFSHVAFITPGEDVSNEWLEPVTDEVYDALPRSDKNGARA